MKKYQICLSEDCFGSYFENLLKYYTSKYVYILHNKDIERNHYHIYFECSASLTIKEIAERLCVPFTYIIEVGFNITMQTIIKYMLHSNSKSMYQYGESDLHSNFDIDDYIKG